MPSEKPTKVSSRSMSDPERDMRRTVVTRLGSDCECVEEATVSRLTGEPARVDVLCRPRAPDDFDNASCKIQTTDLWMHQQPTRRHS
jgi:hypothetical protein